MKRWLVGLLLVVLAGVLLVIVITSNRDPIAALKKLGTRFTLNDQGEVVHIDYYGPKSTDAGLVHLKGLTNLQALLPPHQITDVGLAHLKGLTKLRILNLEHTQITDAGLVHLKGLTKLWFLNLIDTQITDAGVAEQQKALPNCKI